MEQPGIVVVARMGTRSWIDFVANMKANLKAQSGGKWAALYLRQPREDESAFLVDPMIAIADPDTILAMRLVMARNRGLRHHLCEEAQRVMINALEGRAILELSIRGLHLHGWEDQREATHQVRMRVASGEIRIYLDPLQEGDPYYRFIPPNDAHEGSWLWSTNGQNWQPV